MANFLANQLGGNSLVSAVSEAISKTTATDEEKKEHLNEDAQARLQYAAQNSLSDEQEFGAYLADIARARDAERDSRESEHSSWLAQNVHPLLAFGIMAVTFGLFVVAIWTSSRPGFKDSADKDIIIYILGALTTVATQVVSYYFGSSSGSAAKSKTLSALSRRDNG
jgi:hypothetical protein